MKSPATSPPVDYRYHAFLSYTTREEEVQRIKPFIDDYTGHLRKLVSSFVFYDGWSLPLRPWSEEELAIELRRAIEGSAFTVTFLSPSYFESKWCRLELGTTYAVHGERGAPAIGRSILPILWKRMRREYAGPQLAPFQILDISDAVKKPGSADYWKAVEKTVLTTRDYLRAWYPGQF